MPWSTLIQLINEVAPYAEEFCPFLMQEPTMEPRLIQILTHIKQRNPECKTIIYSNMGEWTPELTDKMLDRGVLDELYISFYAPTREHYKTWQPGLDYDETVSNITYLLEQNDGDIFIAFNYITIDDLMGENEETAKLFIDKWRKHAPVRFVHYDTIHDTMPPYGDNDKYFGPPHPERVPCSRIWGGLNILSNGDVVPCCGDYSGSVVFGNIKDESIKEIWRNDKFNEFRQLHLEGRWKEIPLCRDCIVWRHIENRDWVNIWMNEK